MGFEKKPDGVKGRTTKARFFIIFLRLPEMMKSETKVRERK